MARFVVVVSAKLLCIMSALLSNTQGKTLNISSHGRRSQETTPYTPIVGVGVNMVNVFWERLQHLLGEENDDTEGLVDGRNPNHSFKLLKSKGIDLVRFAASPYCQSQFAMWRSGGHQEAQYWQLLDDVMNEAHQAGVRLIPTLMWRGRMPSLACQEPVSLMFQSEKPSCARSLIRLYATEVVTRYQNFDNIVAWELVNELNLEVDINHKSKRSNCHWDNHKKTNGIAYKYVLYVSDTSFLVK
jgi:hypothetical protein